MNLSPADQILQLVAWFLALAGFILACYVLLLNAWHTANRHLSGLLLILAINNLAVGLMLGATDVTQATLPALLLAAAATIVNPGLLIAVIVLLKPSWLRGRWRWVWWPIYGLIFLPVLLTLLDVGLGTGLWYTGLDAETYTGGFVLLGEYAGGSLSTLIKVLNLYVTSLVTIIPLLYVALRDKEATGLTRRLAWLLLGAQAVVIVIQTGLRSLLVAPIPSLITSFIFSFAYAYAVFQQMISERRLQRGKLQTRLTALTLVITVPILVAVVTFVSNRAGALIEQAVLQQQEAELLSALRHFQRVSWTVLAAGVAMLLALAWLTIRQAFRPIGTLTETAAAIAAGDLTRIAPVEGEDEIGSLARAFNTMTGQLRGLIGSLEQRVADRTREMERRSSYQEASAEVGRAASSILDTDRLIRQVVDLIRERFGLYYVGLFLVDEAGEWAVLQAGTGEAGRAMLGRGHRLRVGQGMIGWSIANAQARVALEAEADAVRSVTAELPDTRSEAALPLRSRGQVIGALTVQSDQPGVFDEVAIAVLQMMADQVAVALDNARLFSESQAALEMARRAYGESGRETWGELLRAQSDMAYRSDARGVTRAEDVWLPEVERAWREGEIVRGDGAGSEGKLPLALPIKVRGSVIGVLDTYKPGGSGDWTSEEIALLESLVDQLGAALEGARLYEEAQRRATRERLTSEITDRMRRATDVEGIVQAAVDELFAVLGTSRAFVRLETAAETKEQG